LFTFANIDLYFNELDGKTANFSLTVKPKNGLRSVDRDQCLQAKAAEMEKKLDACA